MPDNTLKYTRAEKLKIVKEHVDDGLSYDELCFKMEQMKPSIEYQIFVGCDDPQIKNAYINDDELTDLISNYFVRKKS